ncbi:phosphatase and actin regulator 4B [Gossypium australe]|uniref:Phosphatase and actin regulator 4B n=1 Tax=Gossypium australe TaxID=47621 RepID=A0A5B6VQX4_9ROSI|nr:phosphatase and actin regulator 4B [Gossypium australe]
MSNTSSSPTTAIRGSSSGANAAATAVVVAAGGGGVTMTMRGPCPPTTATATTITTSYHEQQCPPTAAVVYPVASSGRGFLSTNHSCRPILPYHPHPHSHPFGNPRPPPPPPPLPHPTHFHPPLKGLPPSLHPKVASSPFSHAETKGYKGVRERTKDDSLINVRDRKVRISDGASIYSLCRSWLRNGFPDEPQPQYGDVFKSLPQPLPIPVTGSLPKEAEDREEQVEEEKKEDEQSVENLSTEDLLKRHINRAKKVRSRLRQERLKRIVRYKTRLALLLPPLVEQFRSDAAAAAAAVGN